MSSITYLCLFLQSRLSIPLALNYTRLSINWKTLAWRRSVLSNDRNSDISTHIAMVVFKRLWLCLMLRQTFLTSPL